MQTEKWIGLFCYFYFNSDYYYYILHDKIKKDFFNPKNNLGCFYEKKTLIALFRLYKLSIERTDAADSTHVTQKSCCESFREPSTDHLGVELGAMSLQDEDEQTSECFADMNNNMNSTQDEETFMMMNDAKSEDSQQQEDGEAFFRDLFNVYDVDRVGYILVENFVQISKQNMFDSFLGDDEVNTRTLLKNWLLFLLAKRL